MSPQKVLLVISGYFLVLILISYLTSRKANTTSFFTGDRQSPWYVVAFGMIGASLSGVTFISVPGWVNTSQFTYMEVVLGYLVGYFVIANVLMPLYYRLNLTSIYSYLETRFGFWSYKTGAFFFLVSRTFGASARLFLVATVLQLAIFDQWNIPFWITVLVTIFLIYLYTFRGGIKTIVWTDTLQTLFMLLAVVISIVLVSRAMDLSFEGVITTVRESSYSTIFIWDGNAPNNFFKQFFAGAFIAIAMTGLDQDMMQKNLTCRNLKEAQKNMYWFSITLVFVNLLFLSLGVLLYLYAAQEGIALPEKSDELYPMLAINHMNDFAAIAFILGITAAAYSSADSALTALTTSFCVDFLDFEKRPEGTRRKTRMLVHVAFSFLVFLVIMGFELLNNDAVISTVFVIAGYTYGPLLGLYALGLFSNVQVKDQWVPWVCLLAPVILYIIDSQSEAWFGGFKFGFATLIVNGALTVLGLLLISRRKTTDE